MKVWDTTVETDEVFVPVTGMGGKCVVVKAENSFERLPLAGNRVSKHKSRDVVNFVLEIL